MHCLRRASSRLLSTSLNPSIPRTTSSELFLSSSYTPRPFSARQLRWNSSKNEPLVAPVQALNQDGKVEQKSEAESDIRDARQRTQPSVAAESQSQSETLVEETGVETETITQTPPYRGKRELRMHTLNSRMQEQVQNYSTPESETVYVGNIFYDVEAEDLRARFEKFGTVVRALVVHDNRGLSKGFGYVQFNTVDEARSAIENMHLQVFEGRQVVVQFSHAQLRRESNKYPPSNTLFIGNIPYELTDRDIQAIFTNIKNLVDVRFAVDRRSGAPRGFCHAEFLSTEAAMQAKEKLLLQQPYGRQLRIEYSTRKRVSFIAGENIKAQQRRDWDEEEGQNEEEDMMNMRDDYRSH